MTKLIHQISDRETFAEKARQFGPVRITRSRAAAFVTEGGRPVERPGMRLHYAIDVGDVTWTYTEVIAADSKGTFDRDKTLLKVLQDASVSTQIMREYSASI
jgi:hypothetical protein